MTIDDLHIILARGENTHTEYKEAANKLPVTFYDTVVSFLNREGGVIVLGANDEGKIIGIEPDFVEKMKKDMVTSLNNKDVIHPPVNFPIDQLSDNDKIVLCVKVPVSSQIHTHKGIIFDRENDSDIRIEDDARISELYFRKRNHFTENEIFPYLSMERLEEKLFDKTRAFVRVVNVYHPWLMLSNMDILRSCGFYRRDERTGEEGLTLAAALVFGKDLTIQNILPAYKLDVLVRIKDLDRYDDKLILRTNLIDTYLQVMEFITTRSYLPDKFYMEGDQRLDLRELIFREVVANVIVHREYTSAYPTQMIVYNNHVEITNPNKPLFRGILSLDAFNPYAKNPNIRKFFSEFRWTDEIGSGVRNVHKYLNVYVPGAKPLFIEDDQFKTIVPLSCSVLGKEKAEIFMELVGLDKPKLNTETIEAIETLEIAPEYSNIENPDDLFFKNRASLGWSWRQKGVEYKKLRFQINSELQISDFGKGWSWSQKGVELFEKRTITLFEVLLICLNPQNIEKIQFIIDFNTRNKLRELYLNPLRQEGFLEYTIKEKPNSPDQRYITTEKGRRFLGGFDI